MIQLYQDNFVPNYLKIKDLVLKIKFSTKSYFYFNIFQDSLFKCKNDGHNLSIELLQVVILRKVNDSILSNKGWCHRKMVNIEELQTIDLEDLIIDTSVVKNIAEEIAVANCIIAFKEYDNKLCVAINRSLDLATEEELKFISGKEIMFFYSPRESIINAINNCYCKHSVEKAIKSIESENKFYTNEEKNQFTEEDRLQGFPIVKLTNSIINNAICRNASDIHLEPFQNHSLIRFRIDGVIVEFRSIPTKIYTLICARLKIMSAMNIAEKRIPQDGKIKYFYENKNFDLRTSTIPTIYGEKVVVRILHNSERMKDLDSLGFSQKDEERIKSMIFSPNGIVLVTGPTGSGKTTTLYSMINTLNRKEKNITSIEDPVEYTLENVNQVNVNSKIGFNFSEGLRSILRQDPDVIMVGEIRDEETAEIAMRAAVTGHLVISTLHTNDAAEAIIRLKDMGVPSYFINDALVGIIAQRLVRKVCPYCKEEYSAPENESRNLNLEINYKLYKGNGCNKCNNTGYKGRTVVYEIINMKEIKKDFVKAIETAEELRKYNLKKNISCIRDNCANLVKKGITTYEEFIRINL